MTTEEHVRNNIPNNHAFSVLAACSVPSSSLEFVLIRDPHASSNYQEELMTPMIRNKLNFMNRNGQSSGAFWISWPKFLRFFNSITISLYASDYYDIRKVNPEAYQGGALGARALPLEKKCLEGSKWLKNYSGTKDFLRWRAPR
jgi:hypothetical protein